MKTADQTEVVNEIRNLVHRGWSDNDIIESLQNKGVNLSYVNEVLQYVHKQDSMHAAEYSGGRVQQKGVCGSHRVSRATLVFLLLIIFSIIGGVFFYTMPQKSQTSMYRLEYDIELKEATVEENSMLEFNIKFRNKGKDDVEDADVMYRIMNPSQNIILEWHNKVVVINKGDASKSLDGVLPGKYYIYSEAKYANSQIAVARSLFFDIVKQDTGYSDNQTEIILPVDPVQIEIVNETTQPVDPVPIINASVTEDQPQDNDTTELSQAEKEKIRRAQILNKIDEAKTFAELDSQKAVILCRDLEDTRIVDNCVQQLAKASRNYAYCDELIDQANKDFCYMNYIIDTKDYDKCERIAHPKSKRSCMQLNPMKEKNDESEV